MSQSARCPWKASISRRAAASGIAVSVISGAQFTGSGLTRAVLRGGRYVGVHALGDLAACVRSALGDGGFCHGYHSELDLLGHVYGPGSPAWRMQLRQVDRLVESIVEGLPPGLKQRATLISELRACEQLSTVIERQARTIEALERRLDALERERHRAGS